MLRIYRASDDLVEIEGPCVLDGQPGNGDEIGCWDRAVVLRVGNEAAGMYVRAEYAPTLEGVPDSPGCWALTVLPLDEDVPMPPSRVSLGGRGYSAMLEIECDNDTPVRLLSPKRDEDD